MPTPNPLRGVLNLADPYRPWPKTLDEAGIRVLHEQAHDLHNNLHSIAHGLTDTQLAAPHDTPLGITPELVTLRWLTTGERHTRTVLQAAAPSTDTDSPAARALWLALVTSLAVVEARAHTGAPRPRTHTSDWNTALMHAARWSVIASKPTEPEPWQARYIIGATEWTLTGAPNGDVQQRPGKGHELVYTFHRPRIDAQGNDTLPDTLVITVGRDATEDLTVSYVLNGTLYSWQGLCAVFTSGILPPLRQPVDAHQ